MTICPQCKQEFTPNIKHPFQKFCCHKCYANYRYHEKNPFVIKKGLCPVCHAEFDQKPSHHGGKLKLYCSNKCKNKNQKSKRKPITYNIKCNECHNIFRTTSHTRKYCSKECRHKYYFNHPEMRRKVLENSNRKQKICNRLTKLASSKEDVFKYAKENPQKVIRYVNKNSTNYVIIKIQKRSYPINNKCEMCHELTKNKQLLYHHWKIDNNKAYGLWTCGKCHRLSEAIDMLESNVEPTISYLDLKERINKEISF